MGVEAARRGPLPVISLAVAGQSDEADVPVIRRGPDTARDLVAVDLRKPDIEQHDVGPEFGEFRQSVSRSIGHQHGVTFELQQAAERIGGVGRAREIGEAMAWARANEALLRAKWDQFK